MTLKYIDKDNQPTYLSLSSDVVGNKISGAGLIGRTVLLTDTQEWKIILPDLTLADYVVGSAGQTPDIEALNTAILDTSLVYKPDGLGGVTAGSVTFNQYDPDVPPTSPSAYDDEFDDDTISGWTLPSYDASFNMLQTSNAIHLSESDMHGFLLMQGAFSIGGSYDFYKAFTESISQAWTIVAKVSLGFPATATDKFVALGVRGQSDSYFYELRLGRGNSEGWGRTIYNNGGGAAQSVQTNHGLPLDVYMMLVHDGSKNFSAFVSGDGRGWVCVELNLNLSGFSSFTRLSIATYSGSPNGIAAVDFVRYFSTAGQYKIGLDV